MYTVVLLALLGMIVLLVGLPLLRPAPDTGDEVEAPGDDAPDPAMTERERVLGALAEVEYDYHMNKLSEADYRELKERYTWQAMELLRQDRVDELPASDWADELTAELDAKAEAAVAEAARTAAGSDAE